VGLSGASDPVVWRYAYDNDFIVVTTNAKDFLALLEVEVHPGLIVLRESGLSREEQWNRIEPVLQYLLSLDDFNFMVNKVIEVEAPNRFSVREIPHL
jgi:predicted nuclease of predicted toxin-antitoxin system